jgi:hypothetical protein
MIASPRDKPVCHESNGEGSELNTVYDWVTIAIFAGLVVLFLQRSTGARPPSDTIWHYAPPSIGCAIANYFGNKAMAGGAMFYHLLGAGLIVATLAYIVLVLRPLDTPSD